MKNITLETEIDKYKINKSIILFEISNNITNVV